MELKFPHEIQQKGQSDRWHIIMLIIINQVKVVDNLECENMIKTLC